MQKVALLYADADGIRLRVERFLFSGEFQELTRFSSQLSVAVHDAASAFAKELSGTIVVAGGDDILVTFSSKQYSRDKVLEVARRFKASSGCSLSIGIGRDSAKAYLNLRRAKAAGGSRVTDEEGDWCINE